MNILIIDDERTFDNRRLCQFLNVYPSVCIREGDYPTDEEDKWTSNDEENVFYARTLFQARDWFYSAWPGIDIVFLDHDLGEEDVRTFTRDIEADAHDGIIYDVQKFVIHSMNPLGRKEMYEALHKFYNVEFARVEDLL